MRSNVGAKCRKYWLLAGSGLPTRGNCERGVDKQMLGPATSDPNVRENGIGIRTFSFLHAPIFVTYTGPALRQQHRR